MQKKIATLVLARHPDGFVYMPWDEDPHPSRALIKEHFIAHLARTGHQVEDMEGGHVKIVSGPMVA